MSIIRHHIEWFSLVANSGPSLGLPVLAQAFPQGLDAHDAECSAASREINQLVNLRPSLFCTGWSSGKAGGKT